MGLTSEDLSRPVLVYVERTSTRAVREGLADVGFRKVRLFVDIEKFLEDLELSSRSLLVLEWSEPEIPRILEVSRGGRLFDSRPVYLILGIRSHNILSIVSDYKVGKIRTGEISRETVCSDLMKLFQPTAALQEHSQTMEHLAKLKESGEYQEMETILRDLHERYPENIRWQIELSATLLELKKVDEADGILNDALLRNRHIPRLLHLKSRIFLSQGKYESAEICMKKTTLLNPHNAERLIEFGDVLLNRSKVQEAYQVYEISVGLNRNNSRAVKGKASCDLILGNVNEGIELVQSLSYESERAAVFNNAGVVCIREKKLKHAIRLYDLAINMLQDDKLLAKVTFNKGLALLKGGDDLSALSLFKESSRLDPNFAKPEEMSRKLLNKSDDPNGKLEDLSTEVENLDSLDEDLRGA